VSRRAISILTAIIATFVAFAMPISQLRRPIEVCCCCPDPSHCHCPHDPSSSSSKPTMQACHRVTQDANTPVPSVTIATIEIEVPHDRIAVAPAMMPVAPSPAPDLPRPSAPS
jgi:hypothetical protein